MTNKKKLTCAFCGSTKIVTHENIGWDIDPEGEEDQHLHVCKDCGAECFSFTRHPFTGGEERWDGNWLKDGKTVEDNRKSNIAENVKCLE